MTDDKQRHERREGIVADRLNDRAVMEEANTERAARVALMPAMMLYMLLERVVREYDVQVRPDLAEHVMRYAQKVVAGLPVHEQRRAAERARDDCKSVVHDLHFNDYRHVVVAWCLTMGRLVLRGQVDGTQVPAMYAATICVEAMGEGRVDWQYDAAACRLLADRMESRCALLGYMNEGAHAAPDVIVDKPG